MTGLDVFALFVLFVLVMSVLAAVIYLARWPGQIARERGHPQADAIAIAGWMGLITGVFWPLAMIWAFMCPVATQEAQAADSAEASEAAQ